MVQPVNCKNPQQLSSLSCIISGCMCECANAHRQRGNRTDEEKNWQSESELACEPFRCINYRTWIALWAINGPVR